MSRIPSFGRRILRYRPPLSIVSPRCSLPASLTLSRQLRRHFNDGNMHQVIEEELAEVERLDGRVDTKAWEEFKTSCSYPSNYYRLKQS
jgi:hypothetical protein